MDDLTPGPTPPAGASEDVVRGLVSTIIPVFNRAALLREAVASVLAQSYRPIEIVVVDDGSTDTTPTTCAELKALHPGTIHCVRTSNRGPGAAREVGRRRARGEFLQYLDSDDLLRPRKFEVQVGALRDQPDAGVAYGWTCYVPRDGVALETPWKGSGRIVERMFPSFLVERWWDTPTPLYRRSVSDAAGPWTDLRLEEDWEYDCRVAALGTRLVHCPEFVADVRDHDDARLGRGSAEDPKRNRERARAHTLIHAHALRAGIPTSSPERQHFARALFLLSRQCGASGLAAEARSLFALSREAAGAERARSWDYRAWRVATSLLGWRTASRLACWRDRRRSSRPPSSA